MKTGQRLEEETTAKEALKQEQREAHLYMTAKVITGETFRNHSSTDMCVFEAKADIDPAAPKPYRIRRTMTMQEFVSQVAGDICQDPKKVRLWNMVNRQNKTTRPDVPIMDLQSTVFSNLSNPATQKDTTLRLWAEVSEEFNEEGEPIWPAYQLQSNGDVVKTDAICLLLKHFDKDVQTLSGVGHVYISKEKRVEELVPAILKKMGWDDNANEKLLLWEVSSRG